MTEDNANEWGEIESFAKRKEKWIRKYLQLPYGVPTDDTYRIVIGNINTDYFFHVVVEIPIRTVDGIIGFTGKENNMYGKSVNKGVAK